MAREGFIVLACCRLSKPLLIEDPISDLATHQNTTVSRRLTFNEVMPHTKAVVRFEVPNPRSEHVSGHFCVLDVQYRHPMFTLMLVYA
uniref:Eukaryotic porin/Tom40 n=1 Tax=Tanacetum cinerariifolium TaxID=118510 RepID=A0A699H0I9_TANCI|nr:eukaryotic porin/Tom40 [Tanacetum cinerariifolium]